MLAVSPAMASSVQAPANEAAEEATADHSATLNAQTASSASLTGIVPDGGLHSVARAATAPQSNSDLQQMLQQLLGKLQGQLNVGGAATSATAPHPVSNARAQDPTSQLMALLSQIMGNITKQ